MARTCPRPCAKLISSALFIATGVVQLIAGVILLRSRYAYLLSGPDFWTAATNISVGCLIGIAASVWNRSKKRRVSEYIARYNLLAALLVSSIIVNATTCIILILGEGNALLSIKLDENGVDTDATFANEILGYAYATSVVSPMVCTVVAILSLSWRCCPGSRSATLNDRSPSSKRLRKGLKRRNSSFHSWVFPKDSFRMLKSSKDRPSTSSPDSPHLFSDYDGSSFVFSSSSQASPSTDVDVQKISPAVERMKGSSSSNNTLDRTNCSFNVPLSPLAGEVVSVHISQPVYREKKFSIPVAPPVVPTTAKTLTYSEGENKTSVYVISTPRQSAQDSALQEVKNNFNFGRKQTTFSSFQDDGTEEEIADEVFKEDPRSEVVKKPRKSYGQLISKASVMEPISELPYEDCSPSSSSAKTSGYASSPEDYSEASRSKHHSKTSGIRRTAAEINSVEKRMESFEKTGAIPKAKISKRNSGLSQNLRDQIVDTDSLIGLSHLELVARCYHDHSKKRQLQKKITERLVS